MAQSFDKLLQKLPELRTGNEQFRYFLMKKCFDVNSLVHFFVPHVLIGIFVLINVHQKWIIVSNDFLCDTTFYWLTGNREMLERLHKFGRYIEKNVDISWEFWNDRCRRTVRRVHETFFFLIDTIEINFRQQIPNEFSGIVFFVLYCQIWNGSVDSKSHLNTFTFYFLTPVTDSA